MLCSYCATDFHAYSFDQGLNFHSTPKLPGSDQPEKNVYHNVETVVCSKCLGPHLFLHVYRVPSQTQKETIEFRLFHPRSGIFRRAPVEVPSLIAADYHEANEVLSVSPKASAALSRRCLQAILTSAGYRSKNLSQQIQDAIDEQSAASALPPAIRDSMDAIRNFGNFSAHPLSDLTTLQIIEVDAGEAEWCLELLLDLFDHYYVRPALAAARRLSLSAKLGAAGKPPMKTAS